MTVKALHSNAPNINYCQKQSAKKQQEKQKHVAWFW